jgi:hypothetical protein
VPKYLKLEMLPPSSTTIPAMSSGAVTQEIRLANSMQGQKNIMLKLKITYKHGGQAVSSFSGAILFPTVPNVCELHVQVEEMAQVANFPPGY